MKKQSLWAIRLALAVSFVVSVKSLDMKNIDACYFATVKILAYCESESSGWGAIDYGSADNNNYLKLMWIQYHAEPSGIWV
ncbi:hypothetical protein IBX35_04610 [Candidatus Bathyarchaeota archaeon]|nr:hypothetical protein [Candidatus Bathyarchaeota archaeon]